MRDAELQILNALRDRERELVEAAYADYFKRAELQMFGIPHCDEWVLHAPGVCEYCDRYSVRQQLRRSLRIAFTDQEPLFDERPCPATLLRPAEKINRWGGNVARPATVA